MVRLSEALTNIVGNNSQPDDLSNISTVDVQCCMRCGKISLCDGLGVVRKSVPYEHSDFGKLFRCPNLPAAKDEERLSRLRHVSNLESFANKRFENFIVPRPALSSVENNTLKTAMENARSFAENPSGWLILTGTYGCGKTHLAAAVGNERLAKGDAVLFVTAPDLLDHLRSTFGPTSEIGYDVQFDRIRNAQLLILDDLGSENPSRWASEKLYQLLNHRHSLRMPTVITTNVDLDSIEGRIRSRLLDEDLFSHAVITAPDFRTGTEIRNHQLTDPRHYNNMRFENFDTRTGATLEERNSLERAFRKVRAYAASPNGWLILYGNYANGKTHLAAAIANFQTDHDHGTEVIFCKVPNLMDWLKLSFESDSTLTFQQRFRKVCDVPLLVLDDLPAIRDTPWVREKLFQLIDHRYTAQMPTVLTIGTSIDNVNDRIATRLKDWRLCVHCVLNTRAYPDRIKKHSVGR